MVQVRTKHIRIFTAAPDKPTVTVVAAETSLTFTVDDAYGASMKIWYRVHGTVDWSESSVINSPVNGSTKQITGLTAETQYNYMAIAYSGSNGRGQMSSPGSIGTVKTLASSSNLSADGIYSEPLSNFRALIAACSSFQTWVSHDNSSDAAHHVLLEDLPNALIPGYNASDLDAWENYCFIGHDSWSRPAVATGVSQTHAPGGAVFARFYSRVPASSPDYTTDAQAENAMWNFFNQVSGIVKDMLDLGGQAGYFWLRDASRTGGPVRSGKDEYSTQGLYYKVEFTFTWGFSGG